MPIATSVFMAPGMPMILNGQEVGFGKGMGAPGEPDLNDRRRGIIDWNFGGKDLLTPHYQKLAQIRAQFPAFSQHRLDTNGDGQVNSQDESDFDRLTTNNEIVYSFLRPYNNSNGLTVVNFSASAQSITMDLTSTNLIFTGGFNPGTTYWVNDLYTGTSIQTLGSDLSSFDVSLSPYGSLVYTISIQEETVNLPPIPPIVSVNDRTAALPTDFHLFPNFPNPFNPSTTIRYSIVEPVNVSLKIYDVLGREIRTLINEVKTAGTYNSIWNGYDNSGNRVSSGIYFYRMEAGIFVDTRKMILLK
jgi:hypothetical protein